ncbi:hypothetical protein AVL50_11815 [Flammeovirga sp. SJP92]|nr:hypothetical protein AVL50_11815 [Flammeovirga sp. SJP92]
MIQLVAIEYGVANRSTVQINGGTASEFIKKSKGTILSFLYKSSIIYGVHAVLKLYRRCFVFIIFYFRVIFKNYIL